MDQVEEVKSKVDIVEVISSYVPLKRAGRNLSGLCPFHGEKTPSFMVSPDRQVFKCFGCGEGGDVFTFLEKVEGWEFRETLEELAKRVGVKLKSFRPSEGGKQKEKILSINKAAAKFFSYVLLKHKSGDMAREYLKNRGIKESTWVKFGLGYSPDSWDKTLEFLKKKSFTTADITSSGLVVTRTGTDRGFYDRFRGRLMFPIIDTHGGVVGFSGRIIDEGSRGRGIGVSSQGAKYVNSPETPIFNKGSILFGFNVTRNTIRDKNEAILVEGEFDFLTLYQAGVENVVASKGTALTERQIGILARACENVTLCFDKDIAGDKAARRGIEMMDSAGLNVKVVDLGGFKDPDDFCQKDPAGFKKAIGDASNIYDYYLESVASRYDAYTPYGKKKIGEEIMPIFAKITDDIVRGHYLQKLAKVLDMDVSLVAAALNKKGVVLDVAQEENKFVQNNHSLEKYFLALFISADEMETAFFDKVMAEDFSEDNARRFWKSINDIIRASKTKKVKKVLESLPKDLNSFVDELYLMDIGSVFLEREERAEELLKAVGRIKDDSLKRKMKVLSKDIKIAEEKGDSSKLLVLTREFDKVSKSLKET